MAEQKDILRTIKGSVNKVLERRGIGAVDSPGALFERLASYVKDHRHFRDLLITQEPEKRQRLYDAMRAHLPFKAKPLSVYVMEGAQQAEQEQLPTYDPTTNRLTEYKPPSIGEIAERAIQREVEMQNAKGAMTLTCAKCTFTDTFVGNSKVDATIKARKAGWVYDPIDEKARELCPDCAPSTALRIRSQGNA